MRGDSGLDMNQTMLPEEKPEIEPQWRVKTRKCLDNNFVVTLMTLITVYALFFDDIRMIAFPAEKDDIFYGIDIPIITRGTRSSG